jgi:hypothetical protein
MTFDGLIAFAGPGFDLLDIQQADVAGAVLDEAGLLKRAGTRLHHSVRLKCKMPI